MDQKAEVLLTRGQPLVAPPSKQGAREDGGAEDREARGGSREPGVASKGKHLVWGRLAFNPQFQNVSFLYPIHFTRASHRAHTCRALALAGSGSYGH